MKTRNAARAPVNGSARRGNIVVREVEQLNMNLPEDAESEVKARILRRIERELRDFRLPSDVLPDYVDISVRYDDTLAKIRIEFK